MMTMKKRQSKTSRANSHVVMMEELVFTELQFQVRLQTRWPGWCLTTLNAKLNKSSMLPNTFGTALDKSEVTLLRVELVLEEVATSTGKPKLQQLVPVAAAHQASVTHSPVRIQLQLSLRTMTPTCIRLSTAKTLTRNT
jgi:hypothetical protein